MRFFAVLFLLISFAFAQVPEETPAPVPKKYPKLFIVADIDLMGLTWPDLVVEQATTFTNPLLSSWVKWITGRMPEEVGEIVPCQETCSDDFNKWLQLPQEQNMAVPADYVNSVWMKISYKLRKNFYKADINEWSFEWEGSVVLLDANSKITIASHTIHPETKVWRGLDQRTLNSKLASSMYKNALDHINKSVLKLKESDRPDRLTRLVIQGHKSVSDVFSLMELLKKEGSSLALTTKLDVVGSKEAQIICFYKGEEKSFTDLLSRLKELKSTQSYTLVNEFTGVHHVLKLVAP